MFSPRRMENGAASSNGISIDLHTSASDHSSPNALSVAAKARAGNHSIVDENLTMRGDLESDGDVLVKGKVIGNISCKLLIIDVDALVEGGVTATDVIIRGKAKGRIVADSVRLERTADVDCEICQKSFSAEEGAKIKGTLSMKTSDTSLN